MLLLLWQSEGSRSLSQMTAAELDGIRQAIVVDCTWAQAHGILQDPRLSGLPRVHIASQKTVRLPPPPSPSSAVPV